MPTIGGEEVLVMKGGNKRGEEEELPDHDVEVTSLNDDVVLPTPSFVKDSDKNVNPFGVLESAPSDLSRAAADPATMPSQEHDEHEKESDKNLAMKGGNKGGEEEKLPDHDVEVTSLNDNAVLPTPSFVTDSDKNVNPFGVLESAPSDLSRAAADSTTMPLQEHDEHEKESDKNLEDEVEDSNEVEKEGKGEKKENKHKDIKERSEKEVVEDEVDGKKKLRSVERREKREGVEEEEEVNGKKEMKHKDINEKKLIVDEEEEEEDTKEKKHKEKKVKEVSIEGEDVKKEKKEKEESTVEDKDGNITKEKKEKKEKEKTEDGEVKKEKEEKEKTKKIVDGEVVEEEEEKKKKKE